MINCIITGVIGFAAGALISWHIIRHAAKGDAEGTAAAITDNDAKAVFKTAAAEYSAISTAKDALENLKAAKEKYKTAKAAAISEAKEKAAAAAAAVTEAEGLVEADDLEAGADNH